LADTLPPTLKALRDKAAAQGKRVVLSEGDDPRVLRAADYANKAGLARVSVVGDTAKVEALATSLGLDRPKVHDPKNSELTAKLTDLLVELRSHKGMTEGKAATAVLDRLVFAALLVRAGHADGTVGGAVATTSDTVRAALQIIGKAKSEPLVSSFFLMVLPETDTSERGALVFSDCGLVVDPSAEELAAIAAQAARSSRALTASEPKVAMLSFSTKGSARHPAVTKVAEATALVQAAQPDLAVDGELQFDAAFVPNVGETKAPGSTTAGQANIMIFPDLNAGNIGYKIAQRLGGCQAIGPVLQGLAKPANDLSRGCTTEDIINMIAVTVAQAASGQG